MWSIPSGLGGAIAAPQRWRLESSDNGTDWTQVGETVEDLVDWSYPEYREYQITASTQYRISGYTYAGSNNKPVSRQVIIHNQLDGTIINTVNSDETGYFEYILSNSDLLMLRIVDLDGIYNTELRENIVPVEFTLEL